MKRLWIALAVVALTVASVWLWAPRDVVQGSSAPAQTTVAGRSAVAVPTSRPPAISAAGVSRVVSKRRIDTKERDAYLRRIAEGADRRRAVRERARADASGEGNRTPGGHGNAPEVEGEAGAPSGAIKDRTDGELSDLIDAMGKDLMPLVDECYQAAAERDPTLVGMIDINIDMVGDEDVGGIVESFELGKENEIQDEEMVECIRESTLSTIFPAPEDTGRRGARITLEFGPDVAEAEEGR